MEVQSQRFTNNIKKLAENLRSDVGSKRPSKESSSETIDSKIQFLAPNRERRRSQEKPKELMYSGSAYKPREEENPAKVLIDIKRNVDDFESPSKNNNGSHVLEDILAEFDRIQTDNSKYNSEDLDFSKNLEQSLKEDIAALSKENLRRSPRNKTRSSKPTQIPREPSIEITEVREKTDEKGKKKSNDTKDDAEIIDLSDSDDGNKTSDDETSPDEDENDGSSKEKEEEDDKEDSAKEGADDDDSDDDEKTRLEYLKAKESFRKLKLAKDLAKEVAEDLSEKPEENETVDESTVKPHDSEPMKTKKPEGDAKKKVAASSKENDSCKESGSSMSENESKSSVETLDDEKKMIPTKEDKADCEPKPISDNPNLDKIGIDLYSSLTKDEDTSDDVSYLLQWLKIENNSCCTTQ